MRPAVLPLLMLACDDVGLEPLTSDEVESVPSLFPESTISFGEIPEGSSSVRTLTITPSGDTPLLIRSVHFDDSTAAAFEREALDTPLGLVPGEEISVQLSFWPASVGSFNGRVVVDDGERQLSRRIIGFACDPLPGATGCD